MNAGQPVVIRRVCFSPLMHRRPDAMPVSWVAERSEMHQVQRGENILGRSSITAARKRCAARTGFDGSPPKSQLLGSLSAQRGSPAVLQPREAAARKSLDGAALNILDVSDPRVSRVGLSASHSCLVNEVRVAWRNHVGPR